jgi:hypothetical protein
MAQFNGAGTQAAQSTFLQAVMPWLDSLAYVERYAWFGTFQGYLINSAGTALSPTGRTFMNFTSSS